MSKCHIEIILDDPDRVYRGGDAVGGVVRVDVNQDVRCNGIHIQWNWRTSGRGNTAKGSGETQTVFVGDLTAGQRIEERFELVTPHEPPSYDGTLIKIENYILASVDIPWAFDPKQEMIVQNGGGDVTPTRDFEFSAIIGLAVFAVVGLVGITFLFGRGNAIYAGIVIWAMMAIAALSLLFLHLPKWIIGSIEVELPTTATAGQTLAGEIVIVPRVSRQTGPLVATLVGSERAVKGSGKNSSVRKYALPEIRKTLIPALDLSAAVRQAIPIKIDVGSHLPPSFKLRDNTLSYKIKLQIGLPNRPDWRWQRAIWIAASMQKPNDAPEIVGAASSDGQSIAPESKGITFAETIRYIDAAREQPAERSAVIEAVAGIEMKIEAIPERRLLYAGDDPQISADHYAVWAHAIDPPLALVLYVPHELGDDLEQSEDPIRACGTILDWDDRHQRLRILL